MKYTTLHSNEVLGRAHYVGTFDDAASAHAYAQTQAARARRFATWEVWTGTPDKPGKPVSGSLVRGTS